MTPMDPRARVGDADREETVAALERYASEGYLTLDEFSERSAAAYRATTNADLARLTDDLRPNTEPEHRPRASWLARPSAWSPVVIVVVVVIGVVLLAVAAMAMMMLGMLGNMGDMGGMGDMGDMGGMG